MSLARSHYNAREVLILITIRSAEIDLNMGLIYCQQTLFSLVLLNNPCAALLSSSDSAGDPEVISAADLRR